MNQFMDINVSKREREQFMNIHVSKRWSIRPSPFALRLLSPPLFLLLLSLPLLLSFFNVRPAKPANSLKTKELRKRHFRLKILSQGKPLRLKTLGAKFTQ